MFLNNNPFLYNMPQNYTANPSLVPFTQSPQPPTPNNTNIIWVQGEVGARSYQLHPNSSVILMDNDDSRFYIKTTDASGMATLKSFKFEEIIPVPKSAPDGSDFVSQKEFSEFKSGLEGFLNSLTLTKEKEVSNNESNLPVVKQTVDF